MIRTVLLVLLLAACTATAPPPGPASLQIVPPEYYSRTLHYKIQERHRGRTIERTYDIPVRVETKTGEVQIDEKMAETQRQLGVIEQHIEQMKGSLP